MNSLSITFMLFCCCCAHIPATAQHKAIPAIIEQGKDSLDFVPKGYRILLTKDGDLNKDGRDDIVLILKNVSEDTEDAYAHDSTAIKYNRIFLILFKNDSGYRLIMQANNLALCKVCGWELAEYNKYTLNISNDVLTLFQEGGSTQQWLSTRKFRYQDGSFYMIGMKDEHYPHYANMDICKDGELPGSSYHEVNLVTGTRIVKETDDDCKTVNKHDKIKVSPLIKMADVNLNDHGY